MHFVAIILKCALQPKIAKKSLKNPILETQSRLKSSMLTPLESSSVVTNAYMLSSMAVPISLCNRFHVSFMLNEPIVVK